MFPAIVNGANMNGSRSRHKMLSIWNRCVVWLCIKKKQLMIEIEPHITRTVSTVGCVNLRLPCFLYLINNQQTQLLTTKINPKNVPNTIWNCLELPTCTTSIVVSK
mmetsp:Transcript_15266/g.37688  ORF Transcript_15266/g.37688 Transcript_15266/m.37688 type:complete len:106 (-) Transcript_15266:225-542(-)